jgi:hypothetical protein
MNELENNRADGRYLHSTEKYSRGRTLFTRRDGFRRISPGVLLGNTAASVQVLRDGRDVYVRLVARRGAGRGGSAARQHGSVFRRFGAARRDAVNTARFNPSGDTTARQVRLVEARNAAPPYAW